VVARFVFVRLFGSQPRQRRLTGLPGRFGVGLPDVKLVRDTLGTSYTTSEMDLAMDKVFDSPGALMRIPAFICAECMKTMPGLGSPLRA